MWVREKKAVFIIIYFMIIVYEDGRGKNPTKTVTFGTGYEIHRKVTIKFTTNI